MVVVDGEHYPPVVRSALDELERAGHEVVAALYAGGVEKLPASGPAALGHVPVRSGPDVRAALDLALRELAPEAVMDLSDEPVLDYRRRHELAAVALYRGVEYIGADFRFSPPPLPDLCAKPSLAVIGTGKRTGKTAVAGFAARELSSAGHSPVVVAMGRGGPDHPEVLRGDEVSLEAEDLIAFADAGRHAASDYIEDALLARVPTVGCRRCGGGLAGAVGISNVAEGVAIANDLPGDLILLEGSGAALPPVRGDVTALVVPSGIPEEYLLGYLGPYRLLLADLVVVTLCEEPFGSSSRVSELSAQIRAAYRSVKATGATREEIRVVRTVFRPAPVKPVDGADVYVATTAPELAGPAIRTHLEAGYSCKVVGISHALSDRARLAKELEDMRGADLLLCEIKAAAIDVAARRALEAGLGVVFMDNAVIGVDGDDPADLLRWAGNEAAERFKTRSVSA